MLLCRRDGTILFLLNGLPLKSVTCPDIILDETDPSSFTAKDGGGLPAPARPDIYVTLGLIGRGECEVNFGGKTYTAHGYIRDIGGGIIKSNAPIQARVFGQRLANFSQMLVGPPFPNLDTQSLRATHRVREGGAALLARRVLYKCRDIFPVDGWIRGNYKRKRRPRSCFMSTFSR